MAICWFFLLVTPGQAFDFSGWDALLKKHVSPKTIDGIWLHAVDYRSLKSDPGFKKLVDQLKTSSPDDLKTKEEKLAFWINVYNILAVKVVLDHYPVESIKDAGGLFRRVWKIPAGFVGGKEMTLDEVEHGILRKMDEPRIHVAIVCASVSCPDLPREAFIADKLDDQLDDQFKQFLSNPGKGFRAEPDRNRIYLSSIFKWFEEDFESRGGVLQFIRPYLAPANRKILDDPQVRISYLDYNWRLNGI